MKKNNKICVLIPYFGSFKNYFELWLASASLNSKIDFFIFTNEKSKFELPENVKWISMSFKEVYNRIQNLVSFKISLNQPYDLCDFKPTYGLAFQDYIQKYDWWGFGDVDLIYGDLSVYISEENLNKYEKMLDLGHLTFIKNSSKNNLMWREEVDRVWSYKEAFRYPYCFHFDEGGGFSYIFNKKCKYIYHEIPGMTNFADISPSYDGFRLAYGGPNEESYIFCWQNGRLLGITKKNGKLVEREFTYVHLQKRNMKIEESDIQSMIKEGFYIFPNTFKKIDQVTLNEQLLKESSQYKNIQFYGTVLEKVKRRLSFKYIYENFFLGLFIKFLQKQRNIPSFTNEVYFEELERNSESKKCK